MINILRNYPINQGNLNNHPLDQFSLTQLFWSYLEEAQHHVSYTVPKITELACHTRSSIGVPNYILWSISRYGYSNYIAFVMYMHLIIKYMLCLHIHNKSTRQTKTTYDLKRIYLPKWKPCPRQTCQLKFVRVICTQTHGWQKVSDRDETQ